MRTTTAETTVAAIGNIFSTWGPYTTIVSDNGPQFTSAVFANFCKKWGVQHITSAPYCPQSNGRAEKFVDTLKRGLRKMEGETGTIDDKLETLLYNYRRTPSSSLDGKSPFELMTGRQMPCRTDSLQKPSPQPQSTTRSSDRMVRDFNRHHGAQSRAFKANDRVYYQLTRGNSWSWQPGSVVKRLGKALYSVDTPHGTRRVHVNQMQSRYDSEQLPESTQFDDDTLPESDHTAHEANEGEEEEESSQYSTASSSDSEDVPIPSGRPMRSNAGPTYLSDNYVLGILQGVFETPLNVS